MDEGDSLVRHARHIVLKDFGLLGVEKLAKASAVIFGVGGLGSPVAIYLATSGLGNITLVDMDRIETSNLSRQILFTEANVGEVKVQVAREKLLALNPTISVRAINERVTEKNVANFVAGADVVVDCLDNNRDKMIVHDAALTLRKPFVHAGVLGFDGQLMSIIPSETACLRCIFETVPTATPTCRDFGIFSPLCGMVGSIQASEVIKLLGMPKEQRESFLHVNGILKISKKMPQFHFMKSERRACDFCRNI